MNNQWTEEIERLRTENASMKEAIREMVASAEHLASRRYSVHAADFNRLAAFLDSMEK